MAKIIKSEVLGPEHPIYGGNAVPPILGRKIAEEVLIALKKIDRQPTTNLISAKEKKITIIIAEPSAAIIIADLKIHSA